MNTADYIVKKLEELGINDIFGVPGDYNFNILKSINNNPYTKWIGCTNELNAGYSADGYARIKGYGAIVTTFGVGELSAFNAIAGAYTEYVPVVCIVGVPSTSDINNKRQVHHSLPETDFYRFYEAYKNVTAGFAYLTKDNAKIELDRVFKILVKEKRPVYIALPHDVALMDISDRYVSYDFNSDKDILNDLCTKIADKINNSHSPVILGDILVKRFDAQIEYKEFLSKTNIPFTNFVMGANLADIEAPNYLGGYYGDLKNATVSKYVNETDCMISIGAVYTDLNSFGFKLPFKLTEHIAIFGNHTYFEGKKYDNVKMNDVLDLLSKLVNKKNIEIDKQSIGYKHKDAHNEPVTSDYIYPRLQEFFKENDIVFAEAGLIPYGITQTKFHRNINIESQMLWASIGWATPASFGANIAKPDSRVILITGEGAHQMTMLEVGNMLRQNLKPIIIVINNKGYTVERALMKDFESEINDIVNINYAKFARVFDGDVWTTKVETEDDFDKALKVTQIMNKMCYIEVCTSKNDMPNIVKSMLLGNNNAQPVAVETETKKEIELPQTQESSGVKFETVVHKALSEEG